MSKTIEPEKSNIFVRYIVSDVKESVDFYTKYLSFEIKMQPPGNGFAMIYLGNLHLLLNSPGKGGPGKHYLMVRYQNLEVGTGYKYVLMTLSKRLRNWNL